MKCKICKRGLDFRNKTGMCKVCYPKYRPKMTKREKLEHQYAWRKKNPEKVKATQKKHYLKNRESLLIRARKSILKRTYGLSVEDYNSLLERQNYRCAICDKHKDLNSGGYDLSIDHNHATGKIRGLLCSPCNLSLGGFQDSEAILIKALAYLKSYVSVA